MALPMSRDLVTTLSYNLGNKGGQHSVTMVLDCGILKPFFQEKQQHQLFQQMAIFTIMTFVYQKQDADQGWVDGWFNKNT